MSAIEFIATPQESDEHCRYDHARDRDFESVQLFGSGRVVRRGWQWVRWQQT